MSKQSNNDHPEVDECCNPLRKVKTEKKYAIWQRNKGSMFSRKWWRMNRYESLEVAEESLKRFKRRYESYNSPYFKNIEYTILPIDERPKDDWESYNV